MSFESFNQRFKEELAKITQHRDAQSQELNLKYMGALLRLETQAKTQGNLDLVQATRKEISRVENNGELAVFGDPIPAELKDMQQVMETVKRQYRNEEAEAVVKLVDSLKSYADSRSVDATRENNIPEAVAWRDWQEGLSENETIAKAYAGVDKPQVARNTENKNKGNLHEALQGRVAKIQEDKVTEFGSSPGLFRLGKEPKGNEKRIRSSTPSMQGTGSTQLTGTLILIEEKDITKSGWSGNFKEKSLNYVPRLSISPLVGKSLDQTLVVFDLYKRGSGSKRSIIRTDKILIPSLSANDRVVIDAGKYEYETEEYDSSWSSYDYKSSTDEEFYGFIVTIFNTKGELIFQRASERMLNEYARETAP